jgi:uncharacterized protein YjbI with pentapeptide repeats
MPKCAATMATSAQSGPSNEDLVTKLKEDPQAWNDWISSLSDEDRQQVNLSKASLSGADLKELRLEGVNLSCASLNAAQFSNTFSLSRTNFAEAYLRKANLSGTYLDGSNFSGAFLDNADLSNAIISEAKMSNARLRGANLSGASLFRSDLRGADLKGVNFTDTYLFAADLRETDLTGTDLRGAKAGLLPTQLGGANLTAATLPEPLAEYYQKLDSVSEISDSAKKLFLALLAACLYSWLTIGTTKDVDLITNRVSSPLPIIQTAIPIVGFYVVAPIILISIYFYFHFYLQKLWEELASLPAIFQDGKPLYQRADPWLFNDLVRAHFSKLKDNRPFLSYFQQFISILLAWWIVPITLLLFWGRYLPRHDLVWTCVLAVILSISIASAFQLYRLAKETLEGHERTAFTWRVSLKRGRTYTDILRTILVVTALIFISKVAVQGERLRPSGVADHPPPARTWLGRTMEAIDRYRFANLTGDDVSIRPPNWTGKNNEELDLVKGAELSHHNLRYTLASNAFLAKADFIDSDLRGAILWRADLRYANLSRANLSDATLHQANLRGARLLGTSLVRADIGEVELADAVLLEVDLTDALLGEGTEITYASLISVKGLKANDLKNCRNWEMAFYGPALQEQLHLPPDHNQALEDYMKSGTREAFDSWQLKWREQKNEAAKNRGK